MRLRRLSVATICGAERSRSKKKVALGTLKLAFMRYMGHVSSRNANDTWAGTKKEHFNGVGHEGSRAIE